MTLRDGQTYEYDVVLSFAGEDRLYVEEVAQHLKTAGVKVFYDEYEQAALWGKDLYEHLDEVYRRMGRYCVMFISRAYSDKLWTNHERQSAQARAFQESQEYILPARFDDTEIPGMLTTVGYVDLQGLTPKQLSDLTIAKLGRAPSAETLPPTDAGEAPQYRTPRTGRRAFNPYDEALSFMSRLITELKRRCDAVADVSTTAFEREGRTSLRVVVDGQTAYALDVWMGGFGNDSSVQFFGARGEVRSSTGSINAWGDFVWDKESGGPIFAFHDLSLLGHFPEEKGFTTEAFIEAIWEQVCDAIEEIG